VLERPQMTIRRMCFVCWITKATNTPLEYVILNVFPRQQWLRECISVFLVYVHCLSCALCFHGLCRNSFAFFINSVNGSMTCLLAINRFEPVTLQTQYTSVIICDLEAVSFSKDNSASEGHWQSLFFFITLHCTPEDLLFKVTFVHFRKKLDSERLRK
jgi:hypothetical protein